MFVAACGGGDEPATMVSPGPVQSVTSAGPTAPAFTTAVAGQLASLTMQALRQAVGVPPVGLRASGNLRRLATTGTFRVDCPDSGYMEMTEVPENLPFIGQVGLVNIKEVYKDCSYSEQGTRYTTNGNVTLNGTYVVSENVPQQINTSGNLSTSPGETCPVVGTVTGGHAYAGTVCTWPITIDPPPPAPTPMSPADLLTGRWHGRATFRNSEFGCSGTANVSFDLSGSGESVQGTYSYTIESSGGSIGECSLGCSDGGPVGCSAGGPWSGTARNGSIGQSGAGLTANGEYHPGGEWMGGNYRGSVGGFSVSGDWQAVR